MTDADTPCAATAVAAVPVAVSARRSPRAHVVFRLELPLPLSLAPGEEVDELWHALSHRVMREPNDLLAHARRVLLCRDRRLRHRLGGALADLEHVTGGRGRALRARLLGIVHHRLDATDRAYFARALDAPARPTPACAGRVLPTMAQLHRPSRDADGGC